MRAHYGIAMESVKPRVAFDLPFLGGRFNFRAAMEFAFPAMGKPPDSFSALMTPTSENTFAGVL